MKDFFKLKSLILICFCLFLNQVELKVFAGIFTISEQEEIRIGSQASAQVEKTNQVLSNLYIANLGKELAENSNRPNIPYKFRIINKSEINAFALPSGFIYINKGLIESADTENELVGVIAHEIGHVVAKHSVNQLERVYKAQIGLTILKYAFSEFRTGGVLLTLTVNTQFFTLSKNKVGF